MVKKVFTLVMVIGIIGGILAGCAPKADDSSATPKDPAAAGTEKTPDAGATK